MIDYVIAFILGMILISLVGYFGYAIGFRTGKEEGYSIGYEDGEHSDSNVIDFPKTLDGKFFSTEAAIKQMSQKEE